MTRPERINGWQVFAAPAASADLLAHWPPTPRRTLRDNPKLQAFIWQHQTQTLFVKCFRYAGLRRLAACLGRERGLAGFEAAQKLRAAGIATPAAVALIRAAGCRRSWLLTKMLDGAANCHQLAEAGLSAAMQQRLLQDGLALLLQLHQAGCAHGDFKWANLMWQETAQKLWLIDLDGVTTSRAGSKAQLRDLARFLLNAEEVGVALAELQQAFSDYCQELGLDTAKARHLFLPSYARLARRHGRAPSAIC